MLTAVLIAAILICAVGWWLSHVNALMLLWYLDKKRDSLSIRERSG